MDQNLSLRECLFSIRSVFGQQKKILLSEHRVICPNIQGMNPCFRISWERMQAELVNDERQVVEDLAACPHGSRLSAEYQALPTRRALDRFMKETTSQFLPSLLSEYNPDFGFDLDAFLLVDDEENPQVITEIFPREQKGVVNDAYASLLRCEWPLVRIGTTSRKDMNNLGYFIARERVTETIDFAEFTAKWIMHRGRWYIRKPHTIGLFLTDVVLSVLEFGAEGRETIVAPEISIDFSGRRLGAVIHITTSRKR